MKRLSIAAALLMLPMAAGAQSTGNLHGWHGNNGPQGAQSSRSNAMQAQSITGNNSSAGANVDASSRDRSISAPALPGMASGTCTGEGGGLSGGFWPFTGGLSITLEDKRCTARATAALLMASGQIDLARALLEREFKIVMGLPVEAPAPAAGVPVTAAQVAPTAPVTFSFNAHNN